MSVARLDVGQRVYVLRDWAGDPVGAWGAVVRQRWGKPGAWVRLDVRHTRCPFPPDAEDRATWILTSPDRCSSFAPAPGAACRRCLECIGQAHHWLTSMPDASLMAAGGDPFIPCKHCDARAGVCSECCEGAVWPATGDKCELCLAPGGV